MVNIPIRVVAVVAMSFLSMPLKADQREIQLSKGRHGVVFKHFEFRLTPDNRLLPDKNKFGRPAIDEASEQFAYGQFEIFISAKTANLGSTCKSHYIVRMPQTMDTSNVNEIHKKQELYFSIKNMVVNKQGSIPVVFDTPVGCNLFFRSDRDGAYVDYVGQLKKTH